MMTFNNIKIDRSVVGNISTAAVGKIDVVLTKIRNTGNDEVASQFQQFVQAVLDSKEVSDASRNEILTQLAFISEQLSGQRKEEQGILKLIVKGIGEFVKAAPRLVTLWETLRPWVERALGT